MADLSLGICEWASKATDLHDAEPLLQDGEDDIVKTTGRICALAIAGLIFSNAAAMACLFTTDCSPGSQCVKSSGQVLGMCTGGTFPGNRYDQKPYSSPFDPNRTVGKTCSFNVECGPGNHCAMGSGLYGVCVRP